MQILVAEQTFIFFMACLTGLVLGVVYDVFRILRLAFHDSRWIIFIEDVLFFGIAALITFAFLVDHSQGQIRIFILMGEVFGFVLYYFTVGSIVFRSAKKIIDCIKRVFRWINRKILRPIIHIFAFFGAKIVTIFGYFNKKIEKCCQSNKKDLKKEPNLLYNENIHKKKRKGSKKKLKDIVKNEKGKNKKK